MSLFINAVYPSKSLEKSPIDTAITVLAANAKIEEKNGRLPSGPHLNITFMLPHKSGTPGFKGMRMGGYTKENQTLYFESAVPEHIAFSKNASRFVLVSVQDALENADDFFQNSNVAFNIEQWDKTIRSLASTSSILMKSQQV